MVISIKQFIDDWGEESKNTGRIFAALTDASLSQSVANDHRTLGRMAWHITQTVVEMAGRTGLTIDGPAEETPVPTSADAIKQTYTTAAQSLADQISANWTDDTLQMEDDMYGQQWKRGLTLQILLRHELHHRAQMTVLMRQAGLKAPGVYGPAQEDWAQHNMPVPAI